MHQPVTQYEALAKATGTNTYLSIRTGAFLEDNKHDQYILPQPNLTDMMVQKPSTEELVELYNEAAQIEQLSTDANIILTLKQMHKEDRHKRNFQERRATWASGAKVNLATCSIPTNLDGRSAVSIISEQVTNTSGLATFTLK
jgi:hypothetical protein